jgi:hypothetical protein
MVVELLRPIAIGADSWLSSGNCPEKKNGFNRCWQGFNGKRFIFNPFWQTPFPG